jgi:hypothetical protein
MKGGRWPLWIHYKSCLFVMEKSVIISVVYVSLFCLVLQDLNGSWSFRFSLDLNKGFLGWGILAARTSFSGLRFTARYWSSQPLPLSVPLCGWIWTATNFFARDILRPEFCRSRRTGLRLHSTFRFSRPVVFLPRVVSCLRFIGDSRQSRRPWFLFPGSCRQVRCRTRAKFAARFFVPPGWLIFVQTVPARAWALGLPSHRSFRFLISLRLGLLVLDSVLSPSSDSTTHPRSDLSFSSHFWPSPVSVLAPVFLFGGSCRCGLDWVLVESLSSGFLLQFWFCESKRFPIWSPDFRFHMISWSKPQLHSWSLWARSSRSLICSSSCPSAAPCERSTGVFAYAILLASVFACLFFLWCSMIQSALWGSYMQKSVLSLSHRIKNLRFLSSHCTLVLIYWSRI